MNQPLYFDEVHAGERWISPARTVTEADVVSFAGQTGDFNPLHVDREFARQTPFGQPIAHGLMGLAWAAGLGRFSPWMQTLALVRIVEWNFVKPIFIGDTVHVETEVAEKGKPARNRGRITWKRRLINQSGDEVQSGVVETLVSIHHLQENAAGSDSGNSAPPPAPQGPPRRRSRRSR